MKRLIAVVLLALATATVWHAADARAESALIYFGTDLSRDTFPDTLKRVATSRVLSANIEPATETPARALDPGEPPPWPGDLDMRFRLFEETIGGEHVWEENWENVPVDEHGVFHLMLGSHEPLDEMLFEPSGLLYLEVVVEGDQYGHRRKVMLPLIDPWLTPLAGNAPADLALVLVETINALGRNAISADAANSVDALVKTLLSARLANGLRVPVRTAPGR